MPRIILASASPRRKELMAKITGAFERIPVNSREWEYDSLTPARKAVRRARDKANAAMTKLKPGWDNVVITSDTVVDVDGQDLGKPKDEYDVFRMIKLLSDRWHIVHTAVCVCYQGFMYSLCEDTQVEIGYVDDGDIIEYAKTEEPYDKAGGYAIQGYIGHFLKGMKGDYDNVMGFPTSRVRKLLKYLGVI